MTDFKLLQQALDALEFPHDSEWSNKAKAIEALQHALTQPEKKEQRMTDEQIADWSYKIQIACNKSTSDSDINIIKLIQHIENLYEQGRTDERELAKPEQVGKIPTLAEMKKLLNGEPIELAKREQEPVAYVDENGDLYWCEDVSIFEAKKLDGCGLYTAPQRKPWVGLTDDEIEEAWGNTPMMLNARSDTTRKFFARAIEVKLKELNI